MRVRRRERPEADLDITSFMNLMIVLVPVLLMSMVFSHVTVLDLKLPDLAADSANPEENPENQALELVIFQDRLVVNYPAGTPLKTVVQKDGRHDFALLSDVLQEVKRQLQEKGIEKRDITILSPPNTEYQTIVTAMDTVRSFKTVQAASVVNAELFPDVALGDAPEAAPTQTAPADATSAGAAPAGGES